MDLKRLYEHMKVQPNSADDPTTLPEEPAAKADYQKFPPKGDHENATETVISAGWGCSETYQQKTHKR